MCVQKPVTKADCGATWVDPCGQLPVCMSAEEVQLQPPPRETRPQEGQEMGLMSESWVRANHREILLLGNISANNAGCCLKAPGSAGMGGWPHWHGASRRGGTHQPWALSGAT